MQQCEFRKCRCNVKCSDIGLPSWCASLAYRTHIAECWCAWHSTYHHKRIQHRAHVIAFFRTITNEHNNLHNKQFDRKTLIHFTLYYGHASNFQQQIYAFWLFYLILSAGECSGQYNFIEKRKLFSLIFGRSWPICVQSDHNDKNDFTKLRYSQQ